MIIDLCPSPALYPYYKSDNDTVIVADIFRASATICAIFNNGATAIIPVSNTDEAKEYKLKGYLVGAERRTKKCDFADFGNSPFDYPREKVEGKEVVFTTTNGTVAIEAAKESGELLIGTFPNIDAIAERCINRGERVVVMCAGWNNRINIEDTLFGGALAEKLMEKTKLTFETDSVRMAYELWIRVKDNIINYIKKSDHFQRLVDNDALTDVAFCLSPNSVDVVPVYDKTEKKLILPNQTHQNQ